MYPTLLSLHNLFRWFVLVGLSYSTIAAFLGYLSGSAFTPAHDRLRHWTATLLHIQLTIGFLLYFASPIITYYWHQPREERGLDNAGFFAVIHFAMMLIAVLVATVGSSLAKRKKTDNDKFRNMALFFGISLLIILLAIPWPFFPWAERPLIRTF